MPKAQTSSDPEAMKRLVRKILNAKLKGCESRTDIERAIRATAQQFVDEVPVYAKKQ